MITYTEYLDRLSEKEKKHAPVELFFEGDFNLLTSGRKVSVVGSRKASHEGHRRAEFITKKLIEHEITVVSGLAKGIDTTAHETAIDIGGKTIAVLGTPLDQCFPASNKALLDHIKQHHLAISQFSSGHRVYPSNFPQRNKTMALISDATIIVEASEKSGTRHQGWEALRLGRMVLIMRNVYESPGLTWPKQMLEYGAQVLDKEGLDEVLEEIPAFNSNFDLVF